MFKTFLRRSMLVVATVVALIHPALAQPPAGYYDSAAGKSGTELEAALRAIIDGHTSLSYNGAKDRLWEDVEPENGRITCVYTGRVTTSLSSDTDGMNAEHTWPQSRGADSTPPRSDLHHLFVTDSDWNARRSSLRFANVSSPTSTSPIGARVNASVGFQPPDEYRGDIARAIFYFSVRYDHNIINGAVLGGSNSSTVDDEMGELDDLIEWHFADPPSTHEINRNNRIYGIQRNRNPFIDNPDFITALFELGPVAPAIATATIPAAPRYDSTTTIRATITSDATINGATVLTHWRLGSSGVFNPAAMSLTSGTTTNGVWQMTSPIPAQPGGTLVQYYVEAADTTGLTARQPATGTLSYTSTGPAAPVVVLTTIPAVPRFDQTFTFQAQITSEQPLDESTPTLFQRQGISGTFAPLPMTRTSGTTTNGTYQTAPQSALPGGTVIQYYLTAADTFPTAVRQPASGQLSFTVFEPAAPVAVARVVPALPRLGDPILIEATITSQEGIDPATVIASYETSTGSTGQLAMTRNSGTNLSGVWSTTAAITGLPVGAELRYAVSASDLLGRTDRDPDAGFATVSIAEIPTEIDASGYSLVETASNITVTFPAGTIIPAGGTLIVSRQVSRSEFEAFHGALPAGTVFINAFDVIGGNGLVINGGEIFVLRDPQDVTIDGPTPSNVTASNSRAVRTATDTNTWIQSTAANVDPGVVPLTPTGAGLIITEFSDPAGAFEEAFVEIYFDAPAIIVEPEYSDTWLVR
jgi:endonuclease I